MKVMQGNRDTIIAGTYIILALVAGNASGTHVQPSVFDRGLQEIRQHYSVSAFGDEDDSLRAGNVGVNADFEKRSALKSKSPAKAFVLSLLVPGCGQYYYGSRTKPFLFLGAEITAWALHIKWHNEGEDKTDEFEAYANAYWEEDRYSHYLLNAYEVIDDDSLATGTPGMTHRLPDTTTQQYYEMIGKYDQFSWGWVDAYADGIPSHTLEAGYDNRRITEVVPYSSHRITYASMREDANNAFDRANWMIVVSITNRMISAFEAYFVTRSMARHAQDEGRQIGRLKMKAELRSYSAAYDTPFLNVSYRF